MISNFPTNPMTNMAGLARFEFAPQQYVQTLPAAYDDVIKYPVVFKAGLGFLNGYATIATLYFNEETENTEHGTVYNWEVAGFVPGRDPELLSLMKQMALHRHIVKTQDYSDRRCLVGYRAPLNFGWRFATGAVAGEDRKGFAFRFYGQSDAPAPAYTV